MNTHPLTRSLTRSRSFTSRAFTLVELMLVILLIGLFASIVIFNIQPIGDDGRVVKAQADVKTLGDAVEMYVHRASIHRMPQRLPVSLQELIDGPDGWDGFWEPLLHSKDSLNDPWGRPYHYEVLDENRGQFVVVCYGRDGQPGGGTPYDADINYPWSDDEN